MPMMVKLRNVVTGAASRLLLVIEVAVAAEAVSGAVFAGELAVVNPDEDVTGRWPLRRWSRRCQHPEVVEVVDLAQLGQESGAGQLRPRGLCRLRKQPASGPAVGGEDVGRVV